MSYTVAWDHRALDELHEIWKQHGDREGLQHVVTRLDTQLAHQPIDAGESRQGRFRVIFKFPLVVWFYIDERMHEVRIVHVRTTKR